MPQAVGAVIYTVFVGLSTVLGATGAIVVMNAVVYAAGAYLLNRAASALTPKPPRGKGGGVSVNYSGTGERRRRIYGQMTVGGMQVIPPIATGQEGRYLHIVLALAGHEVDAITDVYFDNDLIGSAQIGAVTGTDADGVVGGGNKYANKAWLRRYTGTAAQGFDYILRQADSTHFTIEFRGRGIAYLAARLRYDEVYPGLPNLTATVRGSKCYDPRSATTAWTSNPALCVRDYLTASGETDIDEASVIAAANVCDQLVAIPGATTHNRYQCHALLVEAASPQEFEDNLKVLVDTMRGRVVKRDGTWYVYAGAWDVPSITIDRADWIGPVVVRPSAPPDERWNAVRAWYQDAARAYQRVECYPRRNSAYETADGGDRIWLELELPGVANEYEAQRHAEYALRASRNQLTMTGRLRPEFFKLATWDTVSVTDADWGFSAKTFRVAAMDLTPMGEVDVTLAEEGSALWTDLAEGEYNVVNVVAGPDPGGSLPFARTNFTAAGGVEEIRFAWDQPIDPMPREQTRLLESINDTLVGATEIWRGDSTGVVVKRQPADLGTKYYWIQGVVGSYTGLYTPASFGLPMGSAPLNVQGITAYLAPSYVALPADYAGVVADYGPAAGLVRIQDGASFREQYAAYAVSSQAGVTGSVNTADNAPWSGQPKGAYRVTACTSDVGVLWITATYSSALGPVPYLLPFTVVKQRSGAAGPMGPGGGTLVANGLMTAIDSTTGRMAGWDGLPAYPAVYASPTSGINGNPCLVLPNTLSGEVAEHREYIPVDLFNEELRVAVSFRGSLHNARQFYAGLACYDEQFKYIGYERESFLGPLQIFTATASAGVRVYKPAAVDAAFAGYHGSYDVLSLRSAVGMQSFFSRVAELHTHRVVAINTAASTSYDTLTLESAPAVALSADDIVAHSVIGATHRYFVSASYAPSSNWTQGAYVFAGEAYPFARMRTSDEATTLRWRTSYVRPYLYAPSSAGAGDVYVDDFLLVKVPRALDPYTNDGVPRAGGAWRFSQFENAPSLPLPAVQAIQFAPYSGASGAGALQFNVYSQSGVWTHTAVARPLE